VRISKPFWLGKTEVTQEQWQAIMGANPSKFQAPEHPVEQVNWADCQTFLAKLNEKVVRKGFRLPTEAEWEYACRAGAATQFHFGNAKEQLRDYAWWTGNTAGRTYPVGRRKPNPWRLYDMPGNVWEWCQDGYGDYASRAQTDPTGLTGAGSRVRRGGSWLSNAGSCRSAYRGYLTPDLRSDYVGFRISRTRP
ncbi:formylglycine-generating enzyme family protein, partial [bacterium]|nr:formylglycine-generating enzyme family protein [bacterium]